MMIKRTVIISLLILSFSTLVNGQESREDYLLNASLSGYWASEKEGGIGLTVVNGWHFTSRLSAGVGVGIHRFSYNSLPVSVRGYYFFNEGVSSPYVVADISYPITVEKYVHAKGRISPEIALGWTFKVGGVTMGPELGYRNERFWQWQLGYTGQMEDGLFVYEDLGYKGMSGNYFKVAFSVFF